MAINLNIISIRTITRKKTIQNVSKEMELAQPFNRRIIQSEVVSR